MANPEAPLPVLSLCSGGGALERGLELAGLRVQPVAYVEREAFAAEYLASQIEAGVLAPAPIFTDLERLGKRFLRRLRGLAGIGVVAGFPCQPWSVAGKRAGVEDGRWIWESIDRVFRLARPEWCFLENTPGLVDGGLEHVLGTMAEVGLDAEWLCCEAGEAGAPMARERIFCLAYADRWRFPEFEECDGECGPGWARAQWDDALRPRLAGPSPTSVLRVADGLEAGRVDLLRLLGNGVCPQQSALAFRELAKRGA